MITYQFDPKKASERQRTIQDRSEKAVLIKSLNDAIERELEKLKGLLKTASIENLAQDPIVYSIKNIASQIKQIGHYGGYCPRRTTFENILKKYYGPA